MIWLFALAISAQAPQDTTGAYLDARARNLVQQARARRLYVDRSISRYQTLAKERISIGLRTRFRDRLFYRRETASRIDWRRGGPINISVLGAREVVPVATAKAMIPKDLDEFLPRLAFDPLDMDELLRIDTTSLRHPLAANGEAHYRFRTGDSTTINLGDRSIKLVELRVEPRRNDYRLITGSFWIDDATNSVVQIVFKLAKDFDLIEDMDEEDKEDAGKIPGFMKPIRFGLDYVTIEYGLIHLRWWLPRLFAAEGSFQMGPIKTPMNYERSYADYQVEGDTLGGLESRVALGDSARRCRPRGGMSISIDIDDDDRDPEVVERRRQRADSSRVARAKQLEEARASADTAVARRAREMTEFMRKAEECSKMYHITVADSAQLLTSAELPGSIYSGNDVLTSDPELAKLAKQLERLAEAPWQLPRPSFEWGFASRGMIRYNKVEALSVGARTGLDLGRLRADGMARIGVADLEPNFELGIARETRGYDLRVAGYRRLDPMDTQSGMGGMSALLAAALLGRDERSYYRTLGGELLLRPGDASSQWFNLRVFGEAQKGTSKETDFSLRHALESSHVFSPNLPADRADQVGVGLGLRKSFGLNPGRPRLTAEINNDASTGTFEFTRHAATLQLGLPLPFNLAGAIEGAAGMSTGSVPLQSLFFLGGTRSLRGYPIGEDFGNAFWRGRVEVGTSLPLLRPLVFSDFGWAGDRDNISQRASMLSVGGGVSLMDGLLRVDLARALRGNTGWRFSASVDALF